MELSEKKAINAKQLKVTFNKTVDAATALDAANYTVKLNASASATALIKGTSTGQVSITLSEDKKSVVITAATATQNIEDVVGIVSTATGTPFQFNIKDVKAANGASGETIAKASFDVKVEDKVAPELQLATATGSSVSNKVVLTFSEPVDYSTTGVFKVDGKVVTSSAGSTPNQVVLTTTENLVAGSTYDVEVLNLKDYAGNLITAGVAKTTVTVINDVTAASITSVTATQDDQIKVVFDKSMNPSTLSSTNVSVLNANGVAAGTYTINAVGGTNNKEFTIDFTSATGTATIFANANTENLNLFFTSSVKDSSGNVIVPVTKAVTLNKDTVAPTVQSVKLVAKTDKYDKVTYANGALVVKFSEDVKAPSSITSGDIKLIDQDGTDITSLIVTGTPVLDTEDSSVVVIPLTTNGLTSANKTATVILAKGITTDDSLGANKNTAATFAGLNLLTGISDTDKPVISAVVGAANNTITFTVTEANLDTTTVQNVDNYRLDGKPLPAGSYVTISSTTVTVHLPEGSVKETRATYAFTISGIKDMSGNVSDTVAVNNVSLTDDVAPTIKSSVINADGTVTVAFSEEVTGAVVTDFVTTLNGSVVTPASVTVVASGADKGKVIIGFTGITSSTGIVNLKIATASTGITGADAAGNKIEADGSIVVK